MLVVAYESNMRSFKKIINIDQENTKGEIKGEIKLTRLKLEHIDQISYRLNNISEMHQMNGYVFFIEREPKYQFYAIDTHSNFISFDYLDIDNIVEVEKNVRFNIILIVY